MNLWFYKPYQGNFVNRNTNEKSRKCFCDECEMGDMFLMLEGLAYSRRYQNMRYLIQAY